jgi:outer membrane lipoprotein-sorting protein
MKRILLIIFMLTTITSFAAAQDEIVSMLEEMERILSPQQYEMLMQMTTTRPGNREQSVTMRIFYKEELGSYMEIESAGRSRGMRFLQSDGSLWMYNPRSGSSKAVRLHPRESFQGSVFSNSDVSDPRYSDRYVFSILEKSIEQSQELGEVQVLTIEGIANSKESPYAKIIFKIVEESYIPIQISYYANSGLLFKEIYFSDYRNEGGSLRPFEYNMISLDQPGVSTRIIIEELESTATIPDRFFTPSYLSR